MENFENYKSLDQKMDDLLRPHIVDLGFELVQVEFQQNPKLTLQIMIERQNGSTVNVDDCAEVSHMVSALLDVEDPVDRAYMLEVTSTGIERPLVKLDDYIRFIGHVAKIGLKFPIDGIKNFKGEIKGVKDQIITLQTDKESIEIDLEKVKKAKLVFTDKLLKESLSREKQVSEK